MFAGSIDKSDFPRFAHRGHPCALICRPGKRSCWKPPPSALFFPLSFARPPPPIAWSLSLIQFVSLRSPHFPFQPSTSPDQWIVRFQLSAHTPLADTPVTSESALPSTPPPLPLTRFPSSEKPSRQHHGRGFFLSNFIQPTTRKQPQRSNAWPAPGLLCVSSLALLDIQFIDASQAPRRAISPLLAPFASLS